MEGLVWPEHPIWPCTGPACCAQERRLQGIEDERGVSRDEMAAALVEVAEGRVPKDRIALKYDWCSYCK